MRFMMYEMRARLLLRTSLWIALMATLVQAMLAQEAKPVTPAAPPDPAAILADARNLYRKGSFDLAIARYNELLIADPKSGDGYAGIVRCYLKQDKIREAEDALQKGL